MKRTPSPKKSQKSSKKTPRGDFEMEEEVEYEYGEEESKGEEDN